MRACHLTDEQLAQWEAQVGQDHWVARGMDWLRYYPQDGWKLIVAAGRALARQPVRAFDRNILLFFARAEFRNMPDDERRALQRASKRFLTDLRARHQDVKLWADHVCLDLFEGVPQAQDLRGALGVFHRLLPEGPECCALFHCLVPKSMEWMANQCRQQKDTPTHWAYYDDLMAFGRTCGQDVVQQEWLHEWVMTCQRHEIHDVATARRILEPLVALGLDLNAGLGLWTGGLASWPAWTTQDHTTHPETRVNALLDLEVDGRPLACDQASGRMGDLIERYPTVRQTPLQVPRQSKRKRTQNPRNRKAWALVGAKAQRAGWYYGT